MKILNVYVAHPTVKDISSFIECFHFEDLTNKYEFRWDVDSPDYLFATEHIYRDKECFTRFKNITTKVKYVSFLVEKQFIAIGIYLTMEQVLMEILKSVIDSFNSLVLITSSIALFLKENSIKNIEEAYQILKTKINFVIFYTPILMLIP